MKHFALDIDGCITNGKGRSTSSLHLHEIQKFIEDNQPSVFLCTGRSAPYVEAIAQVLSINQWCICENGAYIYHPMTDELQYNPLINQATLLALSSFKQRLSTDKYKNSCKPEPGKEVCISLNPLSGSIEELFASLRLEIDPEYLYINHSTTAVDITPKGVDKGSALTFLCQQQSFNLSDIVAIGDSSGDLPFMTLSGSKACPANASDSVKIISDYCSTLQSTEAILDILQTFHVHIDH